MSEDFYADLAPFHDFVGEALDPRFYRPLPDDWWVLVADISGSTRAVQSGRYADVNYVGAACIVAVNNALDGHDIPSVFGGDGATVVVPAVLKEAALDSLLATREWAAAAFALTLRVGAVPVSELTARGAPFEVAKLEFSPGNTMAMFRGSGFDVADALVKDESAGFRLDDRAASADAPNLTSLSCRWAPMPSRNGHVLCLIVGAHQDLSPEESDAVYREVVRRLDDLVHLGDDSASPVKLSSLRFNTGRDAFDKEVRTLTGPRWLRMLKAVFVLTAGAIVFRTGIRIGAFDPDTYRQEMTVNADFRKVNGMMRLILDCTVEQCDAIESTLGEMQSEGRLHFGAHRTGHAVMTCVAPNPVDHQHVHYIDGGDGGLWMAAKALKAKQPDRGEKAAIRSRKLDSRRAP